MVGIRLGDHDTDFMVPNGPLGDQVTPDEAIADFQTIIGEWKNKIEHNHEPKSWRE